jgi:hypothetical protein
VCYGLGLGAGLGAGVLLLPVARACPAEAKRPGSPAVGLDLAVAHFPWESSLPVLTGHGPFLCT